MQLLLNLGPNLRQSDAWEESCVVKVPAVKVDVDRQAEAARAILENVEKYGGEESLMVKWARKYQDKNGEATK